MRYFILSILTITLILSCKRNSRDVKVIEDHQFQVYQTEDLGIKNLKAKDFYKKGLQKSKTQEYLEAKKLFKEANSIEPNNVEILNSLALTELGLYNFQEAINILQRVMVIDSSILKTYVNLGYCYNSNSDYKQAISTFKTGLKYVKNDFEKGSILFNVAVSFYRLNKCTDAIETAELAKEYLNSKEYNNRINAFIEEVKINCKK